MFKKMKNVDAAFRYVRSFTLVIILSFCTLFGIMLYQRHQESIATQNKLYVLVNGKVIEAVASNRKDNIPVEARDQVKTFHEDFFTLDPDEKVIQTHISKALYLADGSAKKQYENLKENGYYSDIIAGNISQRIIVDSVAVNTDQYPYYFQCYATQEIIRATSTVIRNMVTEGYLRDVSRSDNNPHGFIIERWNTLQNKDLKTINR